MFAGLAASGLAAPTPEQLEFFEQRIRPILAGECYECHGAEKQKGGLRVDYQGGLLEGGDSGPALIAGNVNALVTPPSAARASSVGTVC